jgi:hypothetical protein
MLLYYTKNRDEIIDRIIGIKNNTLDVFEILNLLIYSSNLNTVIKKLLEKGYSKSEINQAIIRYNQYGRKIDYIS